MDTWTASDTSHDAAVLDAIKTTERLAHWCGRYTPWTSLDDSGGIWLDVTGCQHLFSGESAMIEDLTNRIAGQGLNVHSAVADTPGAAWAAARYMKSPSPCPSPANGRGDEVSSTESPLSHIVGEGQGEGFLTIIESGAQRELLAPLPVAALRIGTEAAEGLRRLGIRRIGDLYPMSRAPLTTRFGANTLKRLDQALGRIDEPISPISPAPSRRVRITFPDPIGLADDLWAAFERLLAALLQRLSAAGEGVRRLELTGYRSDATLTRLAVGIGRASRDAAHIERLVGEKFDRFDPGFGVEVMILAAVATDPLKPSQRGLSGADAADETLAHLLDRLRNRLGRGRVGSLARAESHMPERASVATSYSPSRTKKGLEPSHCHGPALPRPLHLLSSPEPVEVIAPVPDGPPAAFRWRRRTHHVTRADGPERIAPEWWLEDPASLASGQARVRDYYHVEDDSGVRYWLYRDGLYQTDKAPKWYLHGVFP